MSETDGYIVPDLLRENLRLVFCGTAPSRISARARAYYANPENKFWRTLHQVGLTPELVRPQDYARLLEWDIGLTDIAKRHSGVDAALPREAFAPLELTEKVLRYRPRTLAFTSKRAAAESLGTTTGKLPYGLLEDRRIGETRLWVLPSTSPLGHNHFSLEPWQALAEYIRALE
ncbi:TDG/mug DNA glycosylase family protein [Deinobacterium chartae]|uniref:TDG/mug DNA glycosylase family protein n=1 Tax=Deinobacterium chartae TaxID=521158 RepID=A0A841HYR2_9DEIO|nr:TDG/mug DNA glycosylase family protein [Deinobacterium chartae]